LIHLHTQDGPDYRPFAGRATHSERRAPDAEVKQLLVSERLGKLDARLKAIGFVSLD
jgi:hypothetical protein